MSHRIAKKVLVIGWDAADWQMINPLIQQGKMPTLAKFIKEGVSGNLATMQPILSPMLWTSIATGKRAYEHGICGFIEPSPDGNSVRPVASTSRNCKAIWNILSQSGMKSNVVGWFASHPAEPIDGVVVSNYFPELNKEGALPEKLPEGCIHPPSLEKKLRELRIHPNELGVGEIMPFIPKLPEIDLKKDNRPLKLRLTLAKTASIHNAATFLMANTDWDFTAVYYGAIDLFGHDFIAYHPPQMPDVSKEDFELYKGVMESCYRYHDLMLNALLQYAGKDTVVMIVSDHGYLSGAHRLSLKEAGMMPEACHRNYGIACMNGPGIKQDEKLYGAFLLDIVPNILALLGLAVSDDMSGRVWAETFTQVYQRESNLSWELIPGDDGMHSKEMYQDPLEAAAAMQHLIDLGYIEAPGENTQKAIEIAIRDQKCNRARAYMDAAKFDEAAHILKDLFEQYSEVDFYIFLAIACSMRLAKIKEANNYIGKLSSKLQEKPYVLTLKAVIAEKGGDTGVALKYLKNALIKEPDSAKVYNLIGDTFSELEQWDKAELAYQKALKLDSDNAVTHDRMAKISILKKHYTKAIEHALESVGLIHYSPSAHFHLGVALSECGYLKEATDAFETCLPMARNKDQVYLWLIRLYQEAGDDKKANKYRGMMQSEKEKPSFFFAE